MSIKLGKYIPEKIKKPLIQLQYVPERTMFKLYHAAAQGKLYMPDKLFQKWDVKIHSGKIPNISHPTTYQEKVQWLKLYNRKPEYTKLVDKYEVREFISRNISKDILVPCYGIYNAWSEMNFEELPNEFVIKCTHDSGSVVICNDKNTWDYFKAKQKIENGLKRNAFYLSREWPYKNVKPRIIVEKLLKDPTQPVLNDYKVYCFNGVAKMFLVCTERVNQCGACYNYFDTDWNELDVSNEKKTLKHIDKPKNFNTMIKYAEQLSKDIPFLRVDFYEVEGNLYFGELTFFSGGGRHPWKNEDVDRMLGDWIMLPAQKTRNK